MNWITQLIDKLLCWLPRPYFINPDESGVRITLGKHVSPTPPGWYVDIPLIHEFITVNTATQGLTLAEQSVITADDVDLAIRGAILYKITNAEKAIFETDDFDKSLEAVAAGVIEQFVATKTYDELRDRKGLRDEITRGLREAASGWGIKLQRVYISDIGRVKNIRVLGSSSVTPIEQGE
jgi:regulator of protease activity HflC (stomatin/prohibitin superfamily)